MHQNGSYGWCIQCVGAHCSPLGLHWNETTPERCLVHWDPRANNANAPPIVLAAPMDAQLKRAAADNKIALFRTPQCKQQVRLLSRVLHTHAPDRITEVSAPRGSSFRLSRKSTNERVNAPSQINLFNYDVWFSELASN